jgi:hypothetical protein
MKELHSTKWISSDDVEGGFTRIAGACWQTRQQAEQNQVRPLLNDENYEG